MIHNTVHQTVVHLHQTNHQHIQSRTLFVTALSRSFPAAVAPSMGPGPEQDDPTRPARTARRLARLLSTESARRVLRPFFRDVVHTLIWEGLGRRKGRSHQTLLTLWRLVGWRSESREVELRYAVRQRAAEGLCHLPAPSPPAREVTARTADADAPRRPPGPPPPPGLGRGEFQALVQGVSAELERRSRLDTLRKGGW